MNRLPAKNTSDVAGTKMRARSGEVLVVILEIVYRVALISSPSSMASKQKPRL
ncbi:hypothetical protein Pla52n_28230 [Stieleria varia]|uniref:Uncharacterized protein n=1 Tax=Stieleria varia TaxID=2528005 RepID=A0A5C6B003_9BACT|nr:hypothetical protein Pla52n_28230 [Stieleria varia]